MKASLETLMITDQQEQGLIAFRAQQNEQESLRNQDFLDFYVMWQYEQGYCDDAYLLAKKVEIQ